MLPQKRQNPAHFIAVLSRVREQAIVAARLVVVHFDRLAGPSQRRFKVVRVLRATDRRPAVRGTNLLAVQHTCGRFQFRSTCGVLWQIDSRIED